MTVYLCELLLIGLLWFASSLVKGDKVQKIFKLCAFGSILLMNCLRSFSIDPDTPQYLMYFNLFHSMSWTEVLHFHSIEIGNVVLFKLIGTIWHNERFFVIIMSLITTIPLFVFINAKSKNIYLSLAIFMSFNFWVGTMYIMRQYTAMAFCLLSLVFIDKKTRISLPCFLICIGIAFLFHKTALFFLPVYFLKFLKFERSTIVLFVVAIIFCLVFGKNIVTVLNIFARVSYEISFTGGLNLFIFTCAIAALIPFLGRNIFNDKEFSFFYFMFLYSIIIQSLARYMEVMTRASSYAMVSVMVVVPNFLNSYYKLEDNYKYKPLVNSLIFATLVLMFIVGFDNISISNYSIL